VLLRAVLKRDHHVPPRKTLVMRPQLYMDAIDSTSKVGIRSDMDEECVFMTAALVDR
jgi:hypothetical protein